MEPRDEPGRILVVDDTEANRIMLVRRLERQGHTVEVATNGREALDRLDDGGAEFDLVLLDIMMPVMNGYEVLEQMKADARLSALPVIMISAVDNAESIIRCLELGADDYLPKPFNPLILKARLSASLAKKRLRDRERQFAESLQREMEIGRRIQEGFFPEVLPAADGWELAAYFQPARQVAGDFYDAFPLDGGRRIGLVMADVCDKGVGAALFMALFRSLIRSIAGQEFAAEPEGDDGVLRTLVRINDYIAETHGRANMFATVFLGALDPATGRLAYVNGGHEAPAIVSSGGVRARLDPTGPAVGMLPDMSFHLQHAELAPGETLFAFTDGVTDARGSDGSHFGEELLMDVVGSAASAAALLERVTQALAMHTDGSDTFDDVTLLAVRRAG